MHPERGHKHRTAVAIVTRIGDALQTRSHIEAAPDVGCVIALNDIFAAIMQRTVTQQETQSSVCQVVLVIPGNSAGDQGHTRAVLPAMPHGPRGA